MFDLIPIPTPDTMAGYERLGIVGILLLLILLGISLFLWVMRWGNQLTDRHFKFLGAQTHVMEEMTNSLDNLKTELQRIASEQALLHRRIDNVLLCRHAHCPVLNRIETEPQPPH